MHSMLLVYGKKNYTACVTTRETNPYSARSARAVTNLLKFQAG
jgi:hypothetical protein